MANKALQGKTYTVPEIVINLVNQIPDGEFGKRKSTILSTGKISYEQLKFFKHDIEKSNDANWKPFLTWIDKILHIERDSVNKSKQHTDAGGMSNRFRDERPSIEPTNYNKEFIRECVIQNILNQVLLVENYNEIYDKFYKEKLSVEDFEKIVQSDPTTKNNKMGGYSKWLITLFQNKKLKLEDLYKVKEYLTLFDKFKGKIDKKDINQYKSIDDLFNTIEPFENNNEVFASNSEEEKYIKNNESVKVFENEDWLVVVPKTERAACYYGRGTKWCTAATESNNMFDSYNKNGNLYINIHKGTQEKYQFHFSSKQFMDSRDQEVNILNVEDWDTLEPFYDELGENPYTFEDFLNSNLKYEAGAEGYYKVGEEPSENDLETAIRYDSEDRIFDTSWSVLALMKPDSINLSKYTILELIKLCISDGDVDFDNKVNGVKLIMSFYDSYDDLDINSLLNLVDEFKKLEVKVNELNTQNDQITIKLINPVIKSSDGKYYRIDEYDFDDFFDGQPLGETAYNCEVTYTNGKEYSGVLTKEQIFNYLTTKPMFTENIRKHLKNEILKIN